MLAVKATNNSHSIHIFNAYSEVFDTMPDWSACRDDAQFAAGFPCCKHHPQFSHPPVERPREKPWGGCLHHTILVGIFHSTLYRGKWNIPFHNIQRQMEYSIPPHTDVNGIRNAWNVHWIYVVAFFYWKKVTTSLTKKVMTSLNVLNSTAHWSIPPTHYFLSDPCSPGYRIFNDHWWLKLNT